MKKSLIFLLLGICFTQVKGGPVLGIKGGVVAAIQDFQYAEPETNWDTGISAGLTLGMELEWPTRYIPIVTEIYFSQKGVREKTELISANGTIVDSQTYRHQINYLSFALLIKWTVPAGRVNFYLKAGPRLDLTMGYKTRILDQIYENFRDFQPGLDIGLGIEFTVLSDTVLFSELRYNHDLTNAYQTEYITIKNRSMSLSVGVKL